ATENYTRGQPNGIQTGVLDALKNSPDLIYFSGYPNDVSTVLTTLNANNAPPNLKVLGGDALYELGGYQGGFGDRLRFSAFSYPDQWDILGLSAKKPAFFTEYSAAFSANGQHQGYGFTRQTNDDILSYDATIALLKAASTAAASKTTITADDLKNALGQTSFQGVSGWVTFGTDGDPVNKAIVILSVDSAGHIQMDPKVWGKFLGP
ncbi:MAG: hypothetical protein JOZ18_10145, partial [Chloroflexi bacterium]|nr:hypothetical protein [Chloroflexota bacterium]